MFRVAHEVNLLFLFGIVPRWCFVRYLGYIEFGIRFSDYRPY